MALSAFAPAKINLTLHVTGKDAHGYHLIDSLVAFADIGDALTFEYEESDSFEINGPFGNFLAASDNLVLKAKSLFEEQTGQRITGRITLTKYLPVASGIGGGSSDAAAMLRLLAEETGFIDPHALHLMARQLGADVPVCLLARACRMQGIGDKITPLHRLPSCAILLVNPGISCATKDVFARLRMEEYIAGTDAFPDFPDIDSLIRFISGSRNDLYLPATALFPEIKVLTEEVAAMNGCAIARMSGSGATIFGLFKEEIAAHAAYAALKKAHPAYWCALGKI